MCSFHFKDGQPTVENPYPSQLLGAGFGPQYFCGKQPKVEITQENISQVFNLYFIKETKDSRQIIDIADIASFSENWTNNNIAYK